MKTKDIKEINDRVKIIEIMTKRYFVESHNPLLNFVKRNLEIPVTKKEMELSIIKEELKERCKIK